MSRTRTKAFEIQDRIFQERDRQGIGPGVFSKMLNADPRVSRRWKDHECAISIDDADRALRLLGITVTLGEIEE